MGNKLLREALKYREMGYSVIPVRSDKGPYVKWEPFMTQKADAAQIKKWWAKWPKAGVAIVCGEISGVTVVDVDSADGQDALDEFLPDSLLTPTAKTPRGKHLYFRYTSGIENKVKIITDCDTRNNGGYVVAPPSRNGNKPYRWYDGLKPTDVKPAAIPGMLVDILRGTNAASTPKREHIKKESSLYKRVSTRGDNIGSVTTTQQHSTTFGNIGFREGYRDNTLFHLANCCIKGGMDPVNAEKYLKIIASNCNPPYPKKDISAKIKSALNRQDKRDRNLTQEIRDLISTTSGNFMTTFIYQTLTLTTRKDKKKVSVILGRLEKEGLIEKTGRALGEYRSLNKDCEAVDWLNASTETISLWQPFGLNQVAKLQPGNIILYAGSPNAGKTAVLLNIAKENLGDYKIHYFSSEMGREEFKSRMELFPDVTIDMLSGINLYSRYDNFQDVIKSGSGNLNIIDYLEVPENFYLVGKHLAAIHEKLDGALAVIGLQKERGRDTGRGDSFSLEKPRLYISLDSGVARTVKCKAWQGTDNPNGKEYHFKLVDGCRFIRVSGWHTPPGNKNGCTPSRGGRPLFHRTSNARPFVNSTGNRACGDVPKGNKTTKFKPYKKEKEMITYRDDSTCCCYCKFGDFPEKKNPEDGWTSDNETGFCRRLSPRPFSISEKRLDAKGIEAYKLVVWPLVDIADWCGEGEWENGKK